MAKITQEDTEVKTVDEVGELKAQIEALTKLVKGTADGNKLAQYENKNKRKVMPMARVSYTESEIGGERQYIQSYRIKKDEARSSLSNFTDANSQIYEIKFVGEDKPKTMNINQFTFNVKKSDPIESISITTNDDGIKMMTLPINGENVEFDSRYLN